MNAPFNYFKKHRRDSHLSQSDVAFLLGLKGISVLSRYENGDRSPHAKHLLMLHLIYGVPIEALYQEHKEVLKEEIIDRLAKLHSVCAVQEGNKKMKRRKLFLEDALTRLTDHTYEN